MKVLLDYRLGNTPRHYLAEEEGSLMLVPDEVRKCVIFVLYMSNEGMKLAGTAFFVSIPSGIPERHYRYLVTAKHVIEGIRQKSTNGKVYLRINLKDQHTETIQSELAQWRYHPSATNVDVATVQWGPDQTVYDYLGIPTSMAAMPEVIVKEGIGCGDEVFLPGLFFNHYGQQRNLPIVRIGNIASMPEEPIQTKLLGAIDAYLTFLT